MRRLPLSRGESALVDDADFDWLSRWKWCFNGRYATRTEGIGEAKVNIALHKFIMKTPPGFLTDHINGNRLDNTRANLRIVTPAQNRTNSAPWKNSISGLKGVYWHTTTQKWVVTVRNKERKQIYVGLFEDKILAARAYDKAALAIHGNIARLNFKEKVI